MSAVRRGSFLVLAIAAASFVGDDAEASSSKLESDSFAVEIAPTASYAPGKLASVKVSLIAKGAFHVNAEYPYRFKAASPPNGVSYPKPVLERNDAVFTEKTVVFELPFLPTRAGTFQVGGVLSLSVCTPSSCVIQKAPVDIAIQVQ